MSNETLKAAHFEKVNERGDLVFSLEGRQFAVHVDDRLEQGILASKQIKEENEGKPNPQASATIPISTIQSMIRAGHTTGEIAGEYGLSEALVRRFAQPIETEKRYAVNQFFSSPMPGAPRNRKVSDVIGTSLRAAHVSMDSVTWQATRNKREPWHIHATFEAAGRTIKAEWSWDMRDNSVTPMNSTARKLLKSSDFDPASGQNTLDDRFGPFPVQEGSPTHTNDVHIVESRGSDAAARDSSTPTVPLPGRKEAASPRPKPDLPPHPADRNAGKADGADDWLYGKTPKEPKEPKPRTDAAGDVKPLVPDDDEDGRDESDGGRQKRRSRRSAVPSWDEILFGE
ncbi:DUF3071 domain-containing protein [Bifidobacterium sp. 82T24]|uniref:septation protein SepH n=1 Tax=Bifidobacterium pluvialisilvae TaxID=2834436 RepID=UPI001C5A2379|nr:septation protein SepH [Bifidobacterium pluvialisilvae]MBW3087380.1 DUF3071 domain-containing protein [Bifidobacterium pluvialisilvae]